MNLEEYLESNLRNVAYLYLLEIGQDNSDQLEVIIDRVLCTVTTLRRLARDKQLPPTGFDRQLDWELQDVAALVEKHEFRTVACKEGSGGVFGGYYLSEDALVRFFRMHYLSAYLRYSAMAEQTS